MSTPLPQYCLTTTSGENVFLFTLSNERGTSVTITNYGAIITSFNVLLKDGTVNDIVLGFDNVEDYLSDKYRAGNPYFGAAIGRYGNRIAGGEFSIDGQKYQVTKNNGSCQLHGGNEGFDKKTWTMQNYSERTLALTYTSIDGEEGYPGNLSVTIRFELTDDDELIYEYEAVTDKPTAVNLTHHSYFNLHNGTGTIAGHYVKLNADTVLEQDADFVVTGKLIDVKDTIYDFTKEKKISTNWMAEDGYDQSFILNAPGTPGLHFAAAVTAPASPIKLEVFTSEPLVHFYTGKWIPIIAGKRQQPYAPFSALCLETQKHPNAVNIPSFPDTILRPGEIYHTKTIYRVSQVAEK